MKVLLINPNNTHVIKSNFPTEIDRRGGLFPPLSLLYIATFLKTECRHTIDVLDMQAENINLPHLKNIIKEKNPDVVGVYTTTFNLIDIYLTARTIKEVNSNIHISLGGPHVNIYPDETISNTDVDSLVLGEGEITFSKLVDALEQKRSLNHIVGLIYKNADRIIKTGPPDLIHNLDILPFPDRTLIHYSHYYNILNHDFPSTTMISSRGCPYNCIFCYHSYLGRHVRFRGSDNVVSEMEECLALGIKDIFFYDDAFILDRQRTFDICNGIIQRRLKIHWGIRTRVDSVNMDILTKLKEAGCNRIQFGVEAGTSKILSVLNKGISVTQIKEAFKLAKKAGLETLAYFMLGSPTERTEDILKTIDFAIQLKPDYAHFSITLPLPDTDLYKMALEKGVFKNDFWQVFAIKPNTEFSPQLWNEYLSEKELNHFLKYAYKRFYFRPSLLFKILLKLSSLKELRKKIKMGTELLAYISH